LGLHGSYYGLCCVVLAASLGIVCTDATREHTTLGELSVRSTVQGCETLRDSHSQSSTVPLRAQLWPVRAAAGKWRRVVIGHASYAAPPTPSPSPPVVPVCPMPCCMQCPSLSSGPDPSLGNRGLGSGTCNWCERDKGQNGVYGKTSQEHPGPVLGAILLLTVD